MVQGYSNPDVMHDATELSYSQAIYEEQNDFQGESERRCYEEVLARLASIEAKLDALMQEETVRDFYNIEDFAQRVNRSKFCVREWARLGRIHAAKRLCGRGTSKEWVVSHDELMRYLSHGLLPDPRRQPPCG